MGNNEMKAIIVGYGRAGKRHARHLTGLGVTVVTVDVVENGADYLDLISALSDHKDVTFGVIATPPAQHIEGIKAFLALGVPIMCEKPLCDFGQIPRAKKLIGAPVMLSYNYRWNEIIQSIRNITEPDYSFSYYSKQYRPDIPNWGLLLDHVCHTLDIINCTFSEGLNSLIVDYAEYKKDRRTEEWSIKLKMKDDNAVFFSIFESVSSVPCKKSSGFFRSDGVIVPIESTGQDMFYHMWQSFLDAVSQGKTLPEPGIADGILVQEKLEEILLRSDRA